MNKLYLPPRTHKDTYTCSPNIQCNQEMKLRDFNLLKQKRKKHGWLVTLCSFNSGVFHFFLHFLNEFHAIFHERYLHVCATKCRFFLWRFFLHLSNTTGIPYSYTWHTNMFDIYAYGNISTHMFNLHWVFNRGEWKCSQWQPYKI